MKKIFIPILFSLFFTVQTFAGNEKIFNTSDYITALKKVTDIMVNDVTSPVAAARYYAYVTLAAYETQSLFDVVKYPSFSGTVNQFSAIQADKQLVKSSEASLAIILSVFKTAEKLLPSGYMLKKEIDSVAKLFSKTKKAQLLYKNTAMLTDDVVRQLTDYAKADGFRKLNNLPRYTPKQGDAYWKPTPPTFMAPVEPHWNSLRTFVLDSAQQFKTALPAAYDTSTASSFYTQLKEVYEIVNRKDKMEQDIAMFWDCNPFAVQQIGHVEFGIKKISPGGHWIGITGIACKKKKLSIGKTAVVHVLVSLAMADAFIVCWDEKYRSNRVRPETAMQKLIDPRWHPLLQTPPFPEYVSGHSVVSTAAAIILSKIFGNNFFYEDNTETEFGLPVRKYNSFFQASSEAGISRLYGGIHFRDAIEQGIWLGKKAGEFAVTKLDGYFNTLLKN
jgi:PAP2 superfamily